MFTVSNRRVLLNGARSHTARLQRSAAPTQWYVRCIVTTHAPVPKKRKVWESAEEAVKDVKSGDVVLSGGVWVGSSYLSSSRTDGNIVLGFGLCGTPDTLIDALSKRKDVGKLTAVSNNVGSGEFGLGEHQSILCLSVDLFFIQASYYILDTLIR